MIVGLGLDIAEVDRIEAAIRRRGAAFLERLYTPSEVAYCESHKDKFERYAARFAAKEAAMKALGTGHSHGVLWRDVEVVRRGGPPQLKLHGGAARRFEAMGGRSSLMTITHTDALAMAQVLILGD
jgi:holo-[acyl-carrier protein] synthase